MAVLLRILRAGWSYLVMDKNLCAYLARGLRSPEWRSPIMRRAPGTKIAVQFRPLLGEANRRREAAARADIVSRKC